MKRRPPGEKRHSDREKLQRQRELKEMLRELLEYSADEDEFVTLVKSVKPNVAEEELRRLIKLFRDFVREKRGLS